ncbi:hypothetical protein ACLB90_10595 [Stenotrophomonas sp. LGBM10]|uniref:hypothetical protein n=1 Tax=Stenotrophomonas sp. LGBM10 TaxID=3390038 RepID=UPI00398B1259
MKIRIMSASLLVALLAACGQAPESTDTPAAVPAPAAETPSATATLAEPDHDIEKGVDPSVWDNEGEPEDVTPGEDITCADAPLATYFFTLVGGNTVDDCGRKDPKVLAAFDALMKEAAPAESTDPDVPSLRERLLSGPSAPGKPLQVQEQTWWYYSACQAHQCSTTALDMLYAPTQAKMVGRLVTDCKVRWLGNPSEAQRALIETTHPLDEASLQGDDGSCS